MPSDITKFREPATPRRHAETSVSVDCPFCGVAIALPLTVRIVNTRQSGPEGLRYTSTSCRGPVDIHRCDGPDAD